MIRKSILVIILMTIVSICTTGQIKAADNGVKIDEINFPDESFRGKVSYYDVDKNGYLSDDEIQKVTDIYYDGGDNPFNRKVASLKGIEYFTYLETLYLYETQVTSIDLSQNKNLVKVSILNPLNTNTKELKLPGNGKITELALSNYESNQLDLSMLTQLKKIELKACTNLETIDLSMNGQLRSAVINAKDSTGKLRKSELKTVIIGDKENLKYLSVSNLSSLEVIKFGKTPILDSIYFTNNKKLQSINTVNMPKLRKLIVEGCGLKVLNLSKNPKLRFLNCNNNKLKKMNITKNKALEQLYCRHNRLSKLNIKNNNKLKTLRCDNNKLKTLNLTKNKKLSKLTCKNNKIKKLYIRKTRLKVKKVKCDKKVAISK